MGLYSGGLIIRRLFVNEIAGGGGLLLGGLILGVFGILWYSCRGVTLGKVIRFKSCAILVFHSFNFDCVLFLS